MSRPSCVTHPTSDRFVMLRTWQVVACDGNRCAAKLLHYFEHWHNYRLEVLDKKLEMGETLAAEDYVQWHTEKAIEEGILWEYERKAIAKALDLLYSKGFVLRVAPRPTRPGQIPDRTRRFRFQDEVVNHWLETQYPKMDDGQKAIILKGRMSHPKRDSESPQKGAYNKSTVPVNNTTETTSAKTGKTSPSQGTGNDSASTAKGKICQDIVDGLLIAFKLDEKHRMGAVTFPQMQKINAAAQSIALDGYTAADLPEFFRKFPLWVAYRTRKEVAEIAPPNFNQCNADFKTVMQFDEAQRRQNDQRPPRGSGRGPAKPDKFGDELVIKYLGQS